MCCNVIKASSRCLHDGRNNSAVHLWKHSVLTTKTAALFVHKDTDFSSASMQTWV